MKNVVKKVGLLLVVAFLGTGCALKGQVSMYVLKGEAGDAQRAAADAHATAALLLQAGKSVEEVEGILRAAGLDAETAKKVVALAGTRK